MKPGELLKVDTKALSMPKGRRVGQPGHEKARRYLLGRMSGIGLKPFAENSFELPYRSENTSTHSPSFCNLVGVVPGINSNSSKPILIGAHYDSVIDAPCSDDNATAVAVALAIAEEAVRTRVASDIIVALFDAEEPPWFLGPDMGSIRFFDDHCRNINFKGVLILDLIGHNVATRSFRPSMWIPRIRNMLFVLGAESNSTMADAVDRSQKSSRGLTIIPTLNRYVGDMSDHHIFRQYGQPYLFLTCAQGEHYHSPQDNMNWVNMKKVRKTFRFVRTLITEMDAGVAIGTDTFDSTDFEIRTIRKNLGWLLPFFLKTLGLKELKSRNDIDTMASVLVSAFQGFSVLELESID
jgi:hypothetical protein